MCSLTLARCLEADANGMPLPLDPPELTAGLALGVGRALQRQWDGNSTDLWCALGHLAEIRDAYASVVPTLKGRTGSERIAVWAEIAEAAVEAIDPRDDPMPALLEFASLVRLLGDDGRTRTAQSLEEKSARIAQDTGPTGPTAPT